MQLKTRFGRFIFNQRKLPQWIISKLFPQPILVKLDGFELYVRLDDWAVGARIALKHSYERHVTAVMRPMLQPDLVLVDVGANIGYYSLMAAAVVGDRGKILAFEPSPDNCALLEKSVAQNGFKNVKVFNKAISDVPGIVGFNMDDSNGAIVKEQPEKCTYQVEAVTLDDALVTEQRVDLLKMDVEGAEGLIIQGAERIIRRHKPVIFSEFRPPAIAFRSHMSAETFLDQLRGWGYAISVINEKHGALNTPQDNGEILNQYARVKPKHLDLVAVPEI